MIDFLEAVVSTLSDMYLNASRDWNRETVSQASSLFKSIDFEFIVNLVITQKILSFVSGVTTSLQKRGIDLGDVCHQVQLVVKVLDQSRISVDAFHQDCYDDACSIARKLDVDINKPRTCRRQSHRSNSVCTDELSAKDRVSTYYRLNITIPMLDQLIVSLKERFCAGQESIMKGLMLLPSNTITVVDWESSVQPFLDFYRDEIPSFRDLSAELLLWKQKWNDEWDTKWKSIQDEHTRVSEPLRPSVTELNRLKQSAVPSTVASALRATSCTEIFPNIHYFLTILAVLLLTTCEAERNISCLRRLKTFMRSTMSEDRLTGLALMHTHKQLVVDIPSIIDMFAREHPRRMKLECVLND